MAHRCSDNRGPTVHVLATNLIYRIMQIVRSGKLLRLLDLLVIHGKNFTIVQQFETPYNRKKKFAGKPSQLEANP